MGKPGLSTAFDTDTRPRKGIGVHQLPLYW